MGERGRRLCLDNQALQLGLGFVVIPWPSRGTGCGECAWIACPCIGTDGWGLFLQCVWELKLYLASMA